jgi:uncharacterized membrane protein YidH (DUF202 family)
MRAARFPRWVYGEGSEPDPRFTLANERTFLAWIRTALALTAGGVALEALTVPLLPGLRLAASLLLLVLGLAAVLGAHLGRMLLTRQRKLGSKVEIFLPKGPQRGDSLSGSLSRRTACRCSSPAVRVLRMRALTSDCSFHLDARADFSAAAARSTNSVRSSTAAMILLERQEPTRSHRPRTMPPRPHPTRVRARSPAVDDAGPSPFR